MRGKAWLAALHHLENGAGEPYLPQGSALQGIEQSAEELQNTVQSTAVVGVLEHAQTVRAFVEEEPSAALATLRLPRAAAASTRSRRKRRKRGGSRQKKTT